MSKPKRRSHIMQNYREFLEREKQSNDPARADQLEEESDESESVDQLRDAHQAKPTPLSGLLPATAADISSEIVVSEFDQPVQRDHSSRRDEAYEESLLSVPPESNDETDQLFRGLLLAKESQQSTKIQHQTNTAANLLKRNLENHPRFYNTAMTDASRERLKRAGVPHRMLNDSNKRMVTFREVFKRIYESITGRSDDAGIEEYFTTEDWELTNTVISADQHSRIKHAPIERKLDTFFLMMDDMKAKRAQRRERDKADQENQLKIAQRALMKRREAIRRSKMQADAEKRSDLIQCDDFQLRLSPRRADKRRSNTEPFALIGEPPHKTKTHEDRAMTELIQNADNFMEIQRSPQRDRYSGLAVQPINMPFPPPPLGDAAAASALHRMAMDQIINNWSFDKFEPVDAEIFRVGEFREFASRFELITSKLKCDDDMKQLLIENKSGELLKKTIDTLRQTGRQKLNTYDDIKQSLINYWSRKDNTMAIDTYFKEQKQEDNESYAGYLERLIRTSRNVPSIHNAVYPELEKENLILFTYANGVKDDALQRFASENANKIYEAGTKSTDRLKRLDEKAIAADKKSNPPENMFASIKRVTGNQQRIPYKGEKERNYRHNSMTPGTERGRAAARSYGYQEYNKQSRVNQHRRAAEVKTENNAEELCFRCELPGHRQFEYEKCPKSRLNRRKTELETKQSFKTESFNPKQEQQAATKKSNVNRMATDANNEVSDGVLMLMEDSLI